MQPPTQPEPTKCPIVGTTDYDDRGAGWAILENIRSELYIGVLDSRILYRKYILTRILACQTPAWV